MRPSVIVVRGVGPKDPLQVAVAKDQHPVQALGPNCADPAFREGVRSRGPDRGLDDPHAPGAEDLVERTGELGIPIADEEAGPWMPLPYRQVASLLGDPPRVRVRGGAENTDATGSDLDGEQYEQGAEPRRLHGEKVERQDSLGLAPQELPPTGAVTARGRAQPVRPKERPDPRRGDPDPERGELAPDPEASHLGFSLPIRRISSRTSSLIGGLPPVDIRR